MKGAFMNMELIETTERCPVITKLQKYLLANGK